MLECRLLAPSNISRKSDGSKGLSLYYASLYQVANLLFWELKKQKVIPKEVSRPDVSQQEVITRLENQIAEMNNKMNEMANKMTETKRKTDAKISGLETELGAVQADRLSLYRGNLLVDLINKVYASSGRYAGR
jgi:hypothetical protein